MDEIWKVVERAIRIATLVNERDAGRRGIAQKALKEIADAVRESEPGHPALRRLEEYIADFDA